MGLREEDFWRLTPRQMAATIEDRAAVLAREHDDRAWLAYITASLHRHPRSKKLPPLQKLLVSKRKPRRRQSLQEQQRIMDQWVAVTADPDRLKRH